MQRFHFDFLSCFATGVIGAALGCFLGYRLSELNKFEDAFSQSHILRQPASFTNTKIPNELFRISEAQLLHSLIEDKLKTVSEALPPVINLRDSGWKKRDGISWTRQIQYLLESIPISQSTLQAKITLHGESSFEFQAPFAHFTPAFLQNAKKLAPLLQEPDHLEILSEFIKQLGNKNIL